MHAKVSLLAIPVPHLQTTHPRREISLSYCPSTHSQVITFWPAARKQPKKTQQPKCLCEYLNIFMFYKYMHNNVCCAICAVLLYPFLTHIFMCAVTYNVHTQIINYTLSLPYQTSCGLLCQFMFNWTD